MQAHPLSSSAARIPSTSLPTPLRSAPQKAASAQMPGDISKPISTAISAPIQDPSRAPVQLSRKISGNLSRSAAITDSPETALASTAGLAHDAGNLLGALGLYCDLLSAPGVLRPEHRHYADELNLISRRSSELIRRLLAVTLAATETPSAEEGFALPMDALQPTAGRASAVQESAVQESAVRESAPRRKGGYTRDSSHAFTDNPSATLHSLAPVLQRIAGGVARVSVACPAALPPIDFSAEIIERIIVNLVRNAVQAIRRGRGNLHDGRGNLRDGRGNLHGGRGNLHDERSTSDKKHGRRPAAAAHAGDEIHNKIRDEIHGKIHVMLAVHSGHLELTVEDNGPGMPPGVAAGFLQPSPLPQGATHGLGHRIVHELAAASAGRISVHVRPGKGSMVRIKWPVLPPDTATAGDSLRRSTPLVKTQQEG